MYLLNHEEQKEQEAAKEENLEDTVQAKKSKVDPDDETDNRNQGQGSDLSKEETEDKNTFSTSDLLE